MSGKEGDVTTTYNKYTIGGKELIFRSYNEVPKIDDPAKWLNHADVTPIMTSANENISNIVSSESENAVLVVPTSPEGIISAVREVSGDSTALTNLLNEGGSLSTSEKAKIFLDSRIASTLFDDGNERAIFEGSGVMMKMPILRSAYLEG